MGLRGAVGKDINQCMRVCEESGLESESGWGGWGSSISGCEGRWGKAVGKHNGEMCLRGQVWKHVYEREAFERKVGTL